MAGYKDKFPVMGLTLSDLYANYLGRYVLAPGEAQSWEV